MELPLARKRSGPRVGVVGGGFAGLATAIGLARRHDVTVFDPSPWFEFLPNVHELVSGAKRPADLRLELGRLARRWGFRHVPLAVEDIDPGAGSLATRGGPDERFEVLVVATGAEGSTHGVPGAAEHALPFGSATECAAIGRRLEVLEARGGGPVVVVGGGLEGVEALGEILRRGGSRRGLEAHVVEAGPRLLPEEPSCLGAELARRCAEQGVRLHTGRRVAAVEPGAVVLDDGLSVESRVTLWTGGIVGSALLSRSGLADAPGGWARTDRTLRSRRAPAVFVVGDAAELPTPLPKQAYHALDMGALAARNVARLLAGRQLRPFEASPKPRLIAFGPLDTYLVSGSTVVAGPGLAAAKEAVYQLVMARLDPPTRPLAAIDLGARLGRGLAELAAAPLGSLEALLATPRLRRLG